MLAYSFATALWHCFLLALVTTSAAGDFTKDLAKRAYGSLVKDGSPTNCALVLINSEACAVVASCLDFSTSGSVSMDTAYDVYISKSGQSEAGHARVKKITVHPKYNPENHANDIAVLEYDTIKGDDADFVLGGHYMDTWEEMMYGQRYLVDVGKEEWSDLSRAKLDWVVSDTCNRLSEMYMVNQDYVICSDTRPTTDSSPSKLDCSVPIGATYGKFNGTVCMTGLYSFSVLDKGENICEANVYGVYYTALYLYMGFFEEALGKSVTKIGPDATYTMVDHEFTQDEDNGYRSVGYDFAQRFGAGSDLESDASSSTDDDPSSSSLTDSSSEGLSRQAIIAIAVCIPVVVLVLLALGIWLFCRRRTNQRDRDTLNQVANSNYQDMLVVDPPAVVVPALMSSGSIQAEKAAEPSRLRNSVVVNPQSSPESYLAHVNINDFNELPPLYDDAVAGSPPPPVLEGRPYTSDAPIDEKGGSTEKKS